MKIKDEIMNNTGVAVALLAACSVATSARAQSDGFDWVTITDVGNDPYAAPEPWRYTSGRGSVDYEYRISRLEVTTEQWLPFVRLFWQDLNSIVPTHWGAYIDPPTQTWRLRPVADAGMLPVDGISWEHAAMYVNWLHNGRRSDVASTQSGVYDVSTFTTNPDFTFNHQIEPAPGAKYWIPSLDEWLKAAHYDPNRYGSGQGGWWQYVNSSDSAPVPGLPGEGDTTAFVDLPASQVWDIPLGAYPHVQSPWGLLDLSGGTDELISEDFYGARSNILTDGTFAGYSRVSENLDDIIFFATREPGDRTAGLRIAAAIPGAPTLGALVGASPFITRRRSRSNESQLENSS